jgi:hypothetical protein
MGDMSAHDHWLMPATLDEAREHLSFEPRLPRSTGGRALEGIRIFIRDHKKRDLPVGDRTLELRYAGFGFSQGRKGVDGARVAALETSYGRAPRPADVAGHAGRMVDLGPEVPADDIDGRSSAVVTWPDDEMFFFVASAEMSAEDLLVIARSVYAQPTRR